MDEDDLLYCCIITELHGSSGRAGVVGWKYDLYGNGLIYSVWYQYARREKYPGT